jgi:hypothetical protein
MLYTEVRLQEVCNYINAVISKILSLFEIVFLVLELDFYGLGTYGEWPATRN